MHPSEYQGLTTPQAAERLQQHGLNRLPQAKPAGPLLIFIRQFINPLVYILLAAGGVTLWLGEYTDALFIMIAVAINTVIGAIQEYSAQKSALSLQQLVPQMAMVRRDGAAIKIPVEEVVPDDIVVLTSGDRIPADSELVESTELFVDESMLTGESLPVHKQEKENRLFAGTIVTQGRGIARVTATGGHTEIGKIAVSIQQPGLVKPPLLKRLEHFTKLISCTVFVIVGVIMAISWWQGTNPADAFMLAVALAVAAIPEGLPAAVTIALAIGLRRMAKQNVIVRRLAAVEALGSCTMIASDKTGTLTVNEITARRIILPDGRHFDVTGEGVNTGGEIVAAQEEGSSKACDALCNAGVLANEALCQNNRFSGDTVDIAFLVLGRKAGKEREALLQAYPAIGTIPYESKNGYSASFHQKKENGQNIVFVKGSPEAVIEMCTLMQTASGAVAIDKQAIRQQAETLAAGGYKVLALAQGEGVNPSETRFSQLTLLGLVGMIDPIRSEARDAVERVKAAGVEVVMITGDHPATALAIANDLGMNVTADDVITGQEIRQALGQDNNLLDTLVQHKRIFARVEPVQKQAIVAALMRQKHFVAVTGDGVNDAPALKHSHVGIAMGKRGTDVARESADLIITDDNFSSIVKGIHEGRVIYNNIRKVVYLLLSTAVAEIILVLGALLVGLPLPLLPVQLLWLNLVTNGIQDVALAFDPAEGNEMRHSPRSPTEAMFNKRMMLRVLSSGAYMGMVAFILFTLLLQHGQETEQARNMVLLLMVLFENMQALLSRSESRFLWQVRLFSNPLLFWSVIATQLLHIAAMHLPWIGEALSLTSVSFKHWIMMLLLASGLIIIDSAVKQWMARKKEK